MDKTIPLYFDSVVVESPFQGISESNPNIGRLKVRVFTKYANRNGSYITDAVANQLIASATAGTTPVIGFFDPETQTWASHSGPTLANAYGYVESFIGWEPFQDTDGITREYAVFSVILFTDYYEEAKKIAGQNQSMELDPASITGDWTSINGEDVYVYKTAKMLGFCVIGAHEPCFSVSSFFSKDDDTYKTQYEKISSLLFSLKTQVEEAEKGGEQPMNELENQVEQLDSQETETEMFQEAEATDNIDGATETTEDATVEMELEVTTEEDGTTADADASATEEPEPESDPSIESNSSVESDFTALQEQFNQLQSSYAELQSQYESAQARIAEIEDFQAELESLRTTNARLQSILQSYAAKAAIAENAKKEGLIEKYAKVLSAEEINEMREKINDFSYEELESKLAITFANNRITDSEPKKVPLPEPVESQFALLMQKYRK